MSSNSEPFVSVLMCVYNGGEYLSTAIKSVLDQTYNNYEFIIINDGSTDNSENVILSFDDERIRYIKNEENLRLIASLNKGLSLAKGEYIVRMDADDICMPNRIEKQIEFLELNPDAGLVGSFVETLGNKVDRIISFKTSPEVIKFKLFLANHVFHPTVVIRTSIIKDNELKYKNYLHAEDYKLWVDISRISNIHILPDVLLKYRVHESNISVNNAEYQLKISEQIRLEQLKELGLKLVEREVAIYESWLSGQRIFDQSKLRVLIRIFKMIILGNKQRNIFEFFILDEFFQNSAWELFCKNVSNGLSAYKAFRTFSFLKLSKHLQMKFFLKCLFKVKP